MLTQYIDILSGAPVARRPGITTILVAPDVNTTMDVQVKRGVARWC